MKLGLLDIVFIVLLVLKLAGIVTWSWWWIFSPLIFAVALAFLVHFLKKL